MPYALGLAVGAAELRLFYRSHADLGTNWSISLQLREGHRLVTSGVYARIRHLMRERFGASYDDYSRRSGRLLPCGER